MKKQKNVGIFGYVLAAIWGVVVFVALAGLIVSFARSTTPLVTLAELKFSYGLDRQGWLPVVGTVEHGAGGSNWVTIASGADTNDSRSFKRALILSAGGKLETRKNTAGEETVFVLSKKEGQKNSFFAMTYDPCNPPN